MVQLTSDQIYNKLRTIARNQAKLQKMRETMRATQRQVDAIMADVVESFMETGVPNHTRSTYTHPLLGTWTNIEARNKLIKNLRLRLNKQHPLSGTWTNIDTRNKLINKLRLYLKNNNGRLRPHSAHT
jgi:hypothetical protein